MDSRVFIDQGRKLIKRIKDAEAVAGVASYSDVAAMRSDIQKEVTQLFSMLQNPTLPTAFALRNHAIRNGYSVDSKVMQSLGKFDYFTG